MHLFWGDHNDYDPVHRPQGVKLIHGNFLSSCIIINTSMMTASHIGDMHSYSCVSITLTIDYRKLPNALLTSKTTGSGHTTFDTNSQLSQNKSFHSLFLHSFQRKTFDKVQIMTMGNNWHNQCSFDDQHYHCTQDLWLNTSCSLYFGSILCCRGRCKLFSSYLPMSIHVPPQKLYFSFHKNKSVCCIYNLNCPFTLFTSIHASVNLRRKSCTWKENKIVFMRIYKQSFSVKVAFYAEWDTH